MRRDGYLFDRLVDPDNICLAFYKAQRGKSVFDPKERMICAAAFRERVMQHAVMNVCEPFFEKRQIYDSYACRKGKWMDACLKQTV